MRVKVIAALCLAAALCAEPSAADYAKDCAGVDTTPLPRVKVELTDGKTREEISAEVALSDREKQRGLMCRKTLADGNGMLFPYRKPATAGFWMFNTYIDLDVLYISEDGTVIEAARMKPCPRGSGENRTAWRTRCLRQARGYAPGAPYKAALEIPAGYLERKGFLPGGEIRAEW